MTITDLFDEQRRRAFAIAYQMLGSVAEAEDVVQEAFLRAHQAIERGERIESPPAYMATLVTRLAIDHLRSARARRERYVGEWLPEPLAVGASPADQAETSDSLSLAFLVLLESLTPQQRAAFLLREVFQYPYAEVAEIIGTSVDSARHLVSRARAHVRDRRPRYDAPRQQREELARRFFAAATQGDLQALEDLLAEDVALHVDGGGKVPAVKRPIHGRHRVARALSTGMPRMPDLGLRLEITVVNGATGAVAVDAQDGLVAVMSLDIIEGRIRTIHTIANPDKLRYLERAGHLEGLLDDSLPGGDAG